MNKKQLHSSRYNSLKNPNKTARMTNSFNGIALKNFNNFGGITYADCLSIYPKDIIIKCWDCFSLLIKQNYLSGKGTFIKGLGTFTFTNIEYNLEGTTNEYLRDLKKRYPVFLVSTEFIDYIKAGIYVENKGVIQYDQKKNNNVPIVKINYAKIGFSIDISKEECFTIISSIIKNMADKIRQKNFKQKKMKDLGIFLVKDDILAMKFFPELITNSSLKTQILLNTKKNINLFMETKDSEGIEYENIEDIDKEVRKIRPNISVTTEITKSADNWLQKYMSINTEKQIYNLKNTDNRVPNFKNTGKNFIKNFEKNLSLPEFSVDQRYYRNYPIQNLYGLQISQDILEGILKNKSLLIRNMKQSDRHGDGLIPRFDFITVFSKTNCHHNLRVEVIEKILNIYTNNDPNVIMVNFMNLINILCNDIKKIIDKEYQLFPIDKYKYTILKDNKRTKSQNYFNRDSGNLSKNAISSIQEYKFLPKIDECNFSNDIKIINKILSNNKIIQQNKSKMISYLELLNILQKNNFNYEKEKLILLLKYLDIKNPNVFYFNEFYKKISSDLMNSTSINFKPKNIEIAKDDEHLETSPGTFRNHETPIKIDEKIQLSKSIDISKKSNKINFDNDIDTINNMINVIKQRIFIENDKIDLISEYFDHLLSYDIFREKNIFTLKEFEKIIGLENYNFTTKEIALLFKYIDKKNTGFIDRISFIDAIRNIPSPLKLFHNYLLKNKLSVFDVAYKMEIDLYNIPLNDLLNIQYELFLFQSKIKLISKNFTNNFISELFNTISDNKKYISVKKILESFNTDNDTSYKTIYNKKKEIINLSVSQILDSTSYNELKQKFTEFDKQFTEKLELNAFINIIKNVVGNKFNENYLMHLLRINKFLDKENKVCYTKFNLFILINDTNEEKLWKKCLDTFMEFLKIKCNNDLFLFIVTFNNISNNSSVDTIIAKNRMQEFLRCRIGINIPNNLIDKMDYDGDGKISIEDLRNIIINYIDKHFFDDQKEIQNNILINKKMEEYNNNKKVYLYIKKVLNKNNLTIQNFFYYLDNNKDNYVDKDEFINQLYNLNFFNKEKLPTELYNNFFAYLDEHKAGKIDFNTFLIKLKFFEENTNDDITYKGNSTIENLVLHEFAKYIIYNPDLSDTELFSILDNDKDGVISINDMKKFASEILLINIQELNDIKLYHFVSSISLNGDKNLNMNDIQNFIISVNNYNINKFENKINNFCNEAVNNSWVEEIIYIIGMHLNEVYLNDLKKFYDKYNKNDILNQGQGLSLDNFSEFMKDNYELFKSYSSKKKEEAVFNYISNNKKFINLQDLQRVFCNKFDFYYYMHKYITTFFNENFPTCEDSFKYFHEVKTKSNEAPTSNDYNKFNEFITQKEFFEGINKLFPDKFKTNTILTYYNTILKQNSNFTNKNIITFSEFSYIYYNKINFNRKFKLSIKKDSKIKTNLNHFHSLSLHSSNLKSNIKVILATPYDNDPLEKIKKLILSSKVDFKTEFMNFIKQSGNGKANQFQFRNMIKKLSLGLTNIEIEDIIKKSQLNKYGDINLIDFYKYITDENKNSAKLKQNLSDVLKEIKLLIIKYYTTPQLAFQFNDTENKGTIDFDKFRKIVLNVYSKENLTKPELSYSTLKCVYDFIDIRKDGVLDINEWNNSFSQINLEEKNMDKKLRYWENSKNIFDVYKLIAKNRKIIQQKVKKNCLTNEYLIIHFSNLIDILKEVLDDVNLTATQWKMIVSLGDESNDSLIDFNNFIQIVDLSSKIQTSQNKK